MPSKEKERAMDVTGTRKRSSKAAAEVFRAPASPQILPVAAVLKGRFNPDRVAPHDVLPLQRLVGNLMVTQLLAISSSRQPRPAIQPKLMVGPASDIYEQAADRMARQVMHMPTPVQNPGAGEPESIQPLTQRAAHSNPRRIPPNSTAGFQTDSGFEDALSRQRGGGSRLSGEVRSFMESRFGEDFSGVRVHTDSTADRLSQSIQAKAFTTGQDVFFGQGVYRPESRDGRALIAHELAHVIQQSDARQSSPISLHAKTVRRLSSVSILQRAPWANSPAKFRTDNDSGGKIPNSEYKVTANAYQRYAPINKTRALEQVFHEGPRSFVYLCTEDNDKLMHYPYGAKITIGNVSAGKVEIELEKEGTAITGNIQPEAKAWVFDFDVKEDRIENEHPGHQVEDLGKPLPTLDDPDALKAAKDHQDFLLEQYQMLLKQGRVKNYRDWNKQSLAP